MIFLNIVSVYALSKRKLKPRSVFQAIAHEMCIWNTKEIYIFLMSQSCHSEKKKKVTYSPCASACTEIKGQAYGLPLTQMVSLPLSATIVGQDLEIIYIQTLRNV